MKSFNEVLPRLYICTLEERTAIMANSIETIKKHFKGRLPIGAHLREIPSQTEATYDMGEELMEHPIFSDITAVVNLLP